MFTFYYSFIFFLNIKVFLQKLFFCEIQLIHVSIYFCESYQQPKQFHKVYYEMQNPNDQNTTAKSWCSILACIIFHYPTTHKYISCMPPGLCNHTNDVLHNPRGIHWKVWAYQNATTNYGLIRILSFSTEIFSWEILCLARPEYEPPSTKSIQRDVFWLELS